ncbi:MAG: hypothetical protein ACQEQF_02385 [Bacillota bacterium]
MLLCKKGLLVIVISISVFLLASCSNNNFLSNEQIESFSGSGGPGDFYQVDINLKEKTLEYNNLTTNQSGKESFTEINNNLYKIDSTTVFTKLNDEILIVGDSSIGEENLIVALKEINNNYGEDISGTYNVVTSAEGWTGEIEIDGVNKELEVKLDIDYDGEFAPYQSGEGFDQETLPIMEYSYKSEYKAIEIIESEHFRHYGVFVNNEIAIFDSYMYDNGDWVGDGMFVLIKQDNDVDLSNYEGNYYAFDKDGSQDNFALVSNDNNGLDIYYNGENSGETISSENEKFNGIFEFEFNEERHRMVVLPNKAMVVAYEGKKGDEDSSGLFVGIYAD